MASVKKCQMCGTEMPGSHPLSKYCIPCGFERGRQRDAEYRRTHNQHHRPAAKKAEALTINEIANRAVAAGMTYGQYIAEHETKSQMRIG